MPAAYKMGMRSLRTASVKLGMACWPEPWMQRASTAGSHESRT